MNRKHIPLLIGMMAVAVLPSWGRPRSKSELFQAASATLVRNQESSGAMRSPYKGQKLEILDSNEEYSVIGFAGGSYAIIANDDLIPGVLAYSSTSFEDAESNPGFRWWSSAMRRAVAARVAEGAASGRTLPDLNRFAPEIPHLLSDVWGQMEPFNNLCPLEYDSRGKLVGRCVVGCVATSATQVMRYHQYPPKGTGVYVDMQTDDASGRPIPLKVDFADYTFDWANMRDSYSVGNYTQEEADAVANLCYPVGVSFAMIYGTGASGTYSDSAVVSLREHLGYKNARLMDRKGYDEKTWMETIYNELSNHRPVLYSGADAWGTVGGGGHAFVLDGYDPTGLVHVNWGWYGRNDGYYDVALLNPRIHSFVDQQDMIIGVAPPEKLAGDPVSLKLTGAVTAADLREAVEKSKLGELDYLDLSEALLNNGALPDRAFYGSALRTIILPSTLRTIGEGAFGDCRHLTSVVFPADSQDREYFVEDEIVYSRDGKEVIAVMPYYYNNDRVIEDYTSVLKFREGVTTIRRSAADGCFRVQGLVIPASVTTIESGAFKGCPKLKVVKCQSAVAPRLSAGGFATLDAGYTKLVLPAGSAEVYLRAGEWNKFFAFDNVYEAGTNVMAVNVVRKYGEPNPELTYRIYGDYVTGEPELSCEATASSPAGEYPIKVSMGSLKGEDITLTDGFLRVLEPTAVSEVMMEESSDIIYSIDGRVVLPKGSKIENLEKGVYIVGGKKLLVR